MNRLQLPHAKLFYIISEMFKKNLINDDEKRILKEKAISDDLQIFQVLDKYERTKSEQELEQNLINLVKGKGFTFILNEVSNGSQEPAQQKEAKPDVHQPLPANPIFTNPTIPDEISSPWAEFLRKKKQTQNKESALHDIKKNILEPHNAETDS